MERYSSPWLLPARIMSRLLTAVQVSALQLARDCGGKLVRLPDPAGGHWVRPDWETHPMGRGRKFEVATAQCLVNRGFARFTKFGSRARVRGLVPVELELLPPADLPRAILACLAEMERAAVALARALREAYPVGSVVHWSAGRATSQHYGEVLRHDSRRILVIVRCPGGTIEEVGYAKIARNFKLKITHKNLEDFTDGTTAD